MREREADLEAVIGRVAEEAARLASSGLEDRLARIEEALSRIEERLAALEEASRRPRAALSREDVQRLAEAIASAVSSAVQAACAQQPRGRQPAQEPRWLRILRDRVKARGGVLVLEEEQLPPEVAERLDPRELERVGLRLITLGGRRVVALPEALREFAEQLRGLRTSDEYEAAAKLGRLAALFRLLRGEGLIYYRGPAHGWVLSRRAARELGLEAAGAAT